MSWNRLSGPGGLNFANGAAATTTASPAFGGAYTLRLTATDGDITTFADVSAAITGGPLSYSQWASSHGLPGDGTGSGALTANPAKDGITNAMKFALGLDPNVPSYGGRFLAGTITVSGQTYLMTTYIRSEPPPTGVIYAVTTCSDISTWSTVETVGVSSTPDVPATGLRTIIVRDSVPMASPNEKRFISLEVSVP